MTLGLMMLVCLVGAALVNPVAGTILCAVCLALQLITVFVRMAAAGFGTVCTGRHLVDSNPVPGGTPKQVVFSVHIATHNEPAGIVIDTLNALARQDFPGDRFEVIVMDNNTEDRRLWMPVEQRCRELGPGFRFMHRSGVKGAKAGALNIALDEARKDATYIVTVDADYVVTPRFLSGAADALTRTNADYVQYPQAYAGSDGYAEGVDAELEEYFLSSAPLANDTESLLLTGTLCVISKKALRACGGWSGVTTTEDAELGVRLCARHFVGRFEAEVVGAGMLPLSLKDLQKQRYRWTSGNLQTLALHLRALAGSGSAIELRKRLVIISQLTAWVNFCLLPACVLLTMLMTGRGTPLAIHLAALSILVCAADILWRLTRRGAADGSDWRRIFLAVTSRVALSPVAAQATFDALIGAKATFVVTNKDCASYQSGMPIAATLTAVAAAASLPAAVGEGPMAAMAVVLLLLPLPAALLTDRALGAYRRRISKPLSERTAA
ncbi:MAG: glycosyltransferase family 2 protein [Rhodobacterales bacterium]|nr:glycosyltransferase family 2 protein [Rhodobacterales bacterium]